jgi:hypothetical protein
LDGKLKAFLPPQSNLNFYLLNEEISEPLLPRKNIIFLGMKYASSEVA